MKNKFFYNNFLPILSVFLLVVFILTSSVFANTDFDDDMYYPDGVTPNYHSSDAGRFATNKVLLLDESSQTYFILIYYSSETEATHDNQKLYLRASDNFILGTGCDHYQLLKFVDTSWTYVDWSPHYDITGDSTTNLTRIVSGCSIISTSSDIYTDSSCSEIFFQNPPQGITETLVEETERVQIAEQLKIMIVGFLKYLIVLVISLIAFWKGWKFLLTHLRKA